MGTLATTVRVAIAGAAVAPVAAPAVGVRTEPGDDRILRPAR